ncbi:SRPBCC domain-containing protein [Leifsonia sp. ZF2019]|uniref:SRPBCC family protein n=1 Tax=Leifsonia sp. ZF2019 TaxID=2781978 RepID=UPI001CBF29FC|nr:SRPBCC domain-containing protein [Leifsonia sp. ZF2019]UAJ80687.1 SRPBCC domain-containing protein [Leifsonia sp. ZF2019]
MLASDDLAEVKAETTVTAAPAMVFDALTKPSLLARWFADRAEVSLRPGGSLQIVRDGRSGAGHILDVVIPRRLLIAWDAVQESQIVFPGSELEFFVSPTDGGSRVQSVLWKVPAGQADAYAAELTGQLGRLAALRLPGATRLDDATP